MVGIIGLEPMVSFVSERRFNQAKLYPYGDHTGTRTQNLQSEKLMP